MKSLNINVKDLKKLFSRKHKAVEHVNPNHDWIVIVGTFSVIVLLILVAGVYCFYGIEQGTLFIPSDTSSNQTSTTVDRNSLTSIMKFYSDKSDKLDSLKTPRGDLIDPAL